MANIDIPPPPEPRPAIRHSRPRRSGETVVVACKAPMGLLLRMFEPHEYQEPSQTGMRDVKTFKVVNDPGKQWVIRGTYVASAGQAYHRGNSAVAELLPGGYALTYGVPKEIWDNWYEYNKRTKLVTEQVVFAMPSLPKATERAKELRKVRSGLEPVDPDKPAERMPGGVDRRLKMSVFDRSEQQ